MIGTIAVNLDDDTFPETIIHAKPMALCNRFKQCKACKKR